MRRRMNRRYRRNRSRPISRLRLILVFLLVVCIALFLLADAQLRPLIKRYTANQVKTMATESINSAVNEVLQKQGVTYDNLVSVKQNAEQEIVAVQSNMTQVNMLKAVVTTAVLERLSQKDFQEIQVPLGTLIGSDYLTGRGPKIPIRISISGTALTTLKTQFRYTGINHLDHQIYMDVHVEVFTAAFSSSSTISVDSTFLIAETVVMGKVPDSYTMVNDDQSNLIGKIFDYGDLD